MAETPSDSEEDSSSNASGSSNATRMLHVQALFDILQSKEFKEWGTRLKIKHHVRGIALGIEDSTSRFFKSWGCATPGQRVPFNEHTLVSIGSCSQLFTAAAISKCMDEYRAQNMPVSWHSRMATLLPGDFEMRQHTNRVTVDHIVSHTTNIAFRLPWYRPALPEIVTPRSLTRHLLALSVTGRLPGMLYNPEWINYSVGAYLVQHLSNQGLAENLKRHFWQPLNMDSTFIDWEAARQDRRYRNSGLGVTGYRYRDGHKGDPNQVLTPVTRPEHFGTMSMVSTVENHLSFISSLCERTGPIDDGTFRDLTRVRHSEQALLPGTTVPPYFTFQDNQSGFCAGMAARQIDGKTVFNDKSQGAGFSGHYWFIPGQGYDLSFVCHCNSETGHRVHEIIFTRLMEVLRTGQFDYSSIA